jgi:AraC-like DNA-binding protein
MRCIVLAFTIILFAPAFGQQKMLDSLVRELENHPGADTNRFNILYLISYYSYSSPADTKKYADEALALAEDLKHERGIASAYYLLSIYWQDQKQHQRALDYDLKALRIYDQANDKAGIFKMTNHMAGVYMSWRDYAKAEELMTRLLTMIEADSSLYYPGSIYHNMGIVYNTQGKYDDGIRSLKKAIAIHKRRGNPYGQSVSYHDLAEAQMKSGLLDQAEENYYIAIDFGRKMDNIPAISSSYAGLGQIATNHRKFSQALVHFDSAIYFARSTEDRKVLLDSYKGLSNLYVAQGDFKKALEFEHMNRALSDSIFNKEKADLIAEAQTRYETEKKEQTIQLLERDKKIELIVRNILIAALCLTVVGGLVAYRVQQFRERKNRELLNLKIDYLTVKQTELLANREALTDQSHLSFEAYDERFLKKLLEVVETNIGDPLFGVEKMASEMGMSRANLLRKVKSATGFAPSEFIRSVRLKRAALLLRDQADNVTQIGFMVGFEDQSYFAKSFRRHFGVSPTEYARSIVQ